MTLTVLLFVLLYVGMAVGRLPGTAVDRTGLAVVAAVALWLTGTVSPSVLVESVDFPTLVVLLSLMLLSAQFELAGFYGRVAWRLARIEASGLTLLAVSVAVCGGLAALLTNDVVVFAVTPVLCRGLLERGLDPRPFVIGIACAANVGSAATLIGNPQNVLIGQVGQLDFWDYSLTAAPIAVIGLVIVTAVVAAVWSRPLRMAGAVRRSGGDRPPLVDRAPFGKAVLATALLLLLLATGGSQLTAAMAMGGFLLLSRKLPTRLLLAKVDWPLLCLFTGLFIVTGAFAGTVWPTRALAALGQLGLHPTEPAALAVISLVGSNSVGNVPLVLLLLTILPAPDSQTLHSLGLLSTLAGNLLITGSLANIIAVESARSAGVKVTFREHALCGVPVTLLTMLAAVGWLELL